MHGISYEADARETLTVITDVWAGMPLEPFILG